MAVHATPIARRARTAVLRRLWHLAARELLFPGESDFGRAACTVFVVLRRFGRAMKLLVTEARGGRRHEITCAPTLSVGELKEKLSRLSGVAVDEQDLRLMGDSLCDEATLASTTGPTIPNPSLLHKLSRPRSRRPSPSRHRHRRAPSNPTPLRPRPLNPSQLHRKR